MTKPKAYAVDSKCVELAKHFLQDDRHKNDKRHPMDVQELAEVFQRAAEDFVQMLDDESEEA